MKCPGQIENEGIYKCGIKAVIRGFVVYDLTDNRSISINPLSQKETAAKERLKLKEQKVCK